MVAQAVQVYPVYTDRLDRVSLPWIFVLTLFVLCFNVWRRSFSQFFENGRSGLFQQIRFCSRKIVSLVRLWQTPQFHAIQLARYITFPRSY